MKRAASLVFEDEFLSKRYKENTTHSLQHPGVIASYEIIQHNGLPVHSRNEQVSHHNIIETLDTGTMHQETHVTPEPMNANMLNFPPPPEDDPNFPHSQQLLDVQYEINPQMIAENNGGLRIVQEYDQQDHQQFQHQELDERECSTCNTIFNIETRFKTCPKCRNYQKERKTKKKMEHLQLQQAMPENVNLKENRQKLCSGCSTVFLDDGYKTCDTCRQRDKKRLEKKQEKRIEFVPTQYNEKICSMCCAKYISEKYKTCEPCRLRDKQRKTKKQEEEKLKIAELPENSLNKVCSGCTSVFQDSKYKTCLKCRTYQKEWKAKRQNLQLQKISNDAFSQAQIIVEHNMKDLIEPHQTEQVCTTCFGLMKYDEKYKTCPKCRDYQKQRKKNKQEITKIAPKLENGEDIELENSLKFDKVCTTCFKQFYDENQKFKTCLECRNYGKKSRITPKKNEILTNSNDLVAEAPSSVIRSQQLNNNNNNINYLEHNDNQSILSNSILLENSNQNLNQNQNYEHNFENNNTVQNQQIEKREQHHYLISP